MPAVCFGIARDPCRASQGLCNVLTTIQSFCNITRQSALLNLEILYDRTLIESNSYHHHHHNGHEICFVLLCNTREHKICSWSEIIELVRFKLKEYYIKYSLRHCHKISSHNAPFRGCSFYMQHKKKQGRSLLKTYSFSMYKKFHPLFGKYTIPRSIYTSMIICNNFNNPYEVYMWQLNLPTNNYKSYINKRYQ